MQALYALERCKASDFELAKDQIKEYFTPNLNADIIPDRQELREKEKQSLRIFTQSMKNEVLSDSEEISEEVRKAVNQAIAFFQNRVKEDTQHVQKNMLAETDQLKVMYYKLLLLLVTFADVSLEDIEKRKKSHLESTRKIFAGELNLSKNRIIRIIREHEALQTEVIRAGINWGDDMIDVNLWYREILRKDEVYKAYIAKSNPDYEADFGIIDHIIKQLFFKNEVIAEFFEQQDLHWAENKSAVRSMLRKSIKSIGDENGQMELTRLSADWEEDREFFKDIFKLTIEGDVEYEALVARFVKNWDVDRIAAVDVIILKMALCEMMNFMGIPVKVTINEYIDISKNYGSLKSKQFINGILDKASQVLIDEGKIRKSGRGLIDNK